jgi:hypothetical protein
MSIEGDQELIERDDEDPEEVSLDDFEKKYRDQMRQIVTQKLDLPIAALPGMLSAQITLNPDFQRRDRWSVEQQSRLIESIFMNVPIPPVFLGEDKYGSYVVLDGRQRLTAIRDFMNNTLTLEKLEVWDQLNGTRYQDLVKKGLDKHLTRRFVPAIVILKESSPVVKYDVFDRLNTGGIKANDMEIRNAVFRGGFTDLLHELSRSEVFCKLWRIPTELVEAADKNAMYREMSDLYLVLRFFALCEHKSMKLKFKDYLSDFMQQKNEVYPKKDAIPSDFKDRFNFAVQNCLNIFGDEAFLKPENSRGQRVKSFPLSDAVMVALSEYEPSTLDLKVRDKIKTNFNSLFKDEPFLKAITSGTNGKGSIASRIELAKNAVRQAL